jgi:Kef-type K+ transport system membrane component KefB
MCIYGFSEFGSDEFFKAVFIGCIMTATSVGITVEVLKELGKLKTRAGQTILSAAIIDDVIGMIVLTFVLGFKDPSSNTLVVTGKIGLFLVLSLVLGYIFYKLFKFYDERHAHTRRIPIIAITLCFIMAYVAEKYFGIADITGAYIAGIILCNVRDAEYIDRRVNINGYMFFAPVFFVGIGLKTDFSNVDSSMIVFSVGFVIVAMLTKVIGCGFVSKCFKYSWKDCLKIGAGMMTRGEVALIITNKGLGLGIIDSSYFTAVILLIIVSSIVTPVVLKLLFSKSENEEEKVLETVENKS